MVEPGKIFVVIATYGIAGAIIFYNMMFMGGPGIILFAVADAIWCFTLPELHGDDLETIGIEFGIVWPILMAVIVTYVTFKKRPDKEVIKSFWHKVVVVILWLTIPTLVMALVFHLNAIWDTFSI